MWVLVIGAYAIMKKMELAELADEEISGVGRYSVVSEEISAESACAPLTDDTVAAHDSEPAYPLIDCGLSEELQRYTYDLCCECGVDYYIVMAVMLHESSFNEDAVSSSGRDFGLMQIRDVNHDTLREELGITDIMDPRQNIRCGIYMLAELMSKYEHANLALMAYNMGEGAAADAWASGVWNTDFSTAVMNTAEEWAKCPIAEETE